MEGNQQNLMRHGERVFRVLVDTIEGYAICAMDTEGRIASWIPGAVRIYGYEENEAIGQSIATIFTEEDRRAGLPARELHNAALNGRSESQRWHVRKNGSRLWALISISVDSEGNEAVVRVLDHGAGIPPDRLASIFDLFSQAHPDLPASGLGIGLALAHDSYPCTTVRSRPEARASAKAVNSS